MADNIEESSEWQALQQHYHASGKHFVLQALFKDDGARAERLSARVAVAGTPILLDYSKNLVDRETMRLLCALAERARVREKTEAMFCGAAINTTEARPVLHVALRGRQGDFDFELGDGVNVGAAVAREKKRFLALAEAVRGGGWTGYTGERFTDVVNIGIGGSDLGPAMACTALAACTDISPSSSSSPRIHFVSNIDGQQIGTVLATLNHKTTLFVIVSKTFTTQETLQNAETARHWVLKAAERERAATVSAPAAIISKHFVAVSTNAEKVRQFGIDPDAGMVGFWEWVGGRYSVWSAVGLSLAICIGRDAFEQFLDGARAIDQHFRTAPLETNMPVIMALVGIWYRNFFGTQTHAILPYEQALSRLPAYLQQLEMESNGKSVTASGNSLCYDTCPVIWGEPGTNGQHAFFQMLHQGTTMVPCDFLAGVLPRCGHVAGSPEIAARHHSMLLANFLAQTRALMLGRAGCRRADDEPHRRFPGNRPSTTILYERLDAATLGALIALYEHKVFVQGVVWNVNSFDQFGVELGKEMAGELLPGLAGEAGRLDLDQSTRQLLQFIVERTEQSGK